MLIEWELTHALWRLYLYWVNDNHAKYPLEDAPNVTSMYRSADELHPAAFNTRSARSVTHGFGSFIFPNRIQVLPS